MEALSLVDAREVVDQVFAAILDRPADPDAQKHYAALMFKGELTVRELVRQLAYSDEFATRIMLGLPLAEVAHGLFNRFLGRPAEDDMAAKQLALRILAHGWRSQIDWFINSGEYLKKFGDDTPPG